MSDGVRIWGPTVDTQLTAYNDSTEALTFVGSYAGSFPSGRKFSLIQGTGDYATPVTGVKTSAGAVNSGGNTVITVSGGFTLAGNSPSGSSGTKGIIRGPLDYIDLTDGFSGLVPAYNNPKSPFTDRYGLKKEVRPGDSTALQRFVLSLALEIETMDFDLLTAAGVKFYEFLRTHCISADNLLTFFKQYDGVDSGGTAYTEKDCYTGRLEDIPGWMYGTKLNAGEQNKLALLFTCQGSAAATQGDGVYTDFDSFTTTTYRARPA